MALEHGKDRSSRQRFQKQLLSNLHQQGMVAGGKNGGVQHLRLIPFAGISMLPSLRRGDILTVLNPTEHRVRVGDIALFPREVNAFVAHRIVTLRHGNRIAVTQGDSRLFKDAPRRLDDCCGYVVAVWRNGRLLAAPPRPSAVTRFQSMLKLYIPRLLEKIRKLAKEAKHER